MMSDGERARAYVRAMEPSVSGSGGHTALYRAAVVLVLGWELGDEEALQVLREEFNPRCSPEWSERELRHKVESARGTGRPPDGKGVGWLRGERREGGAERTGGSPAVAAAPRRDDGRRPFDLEKLRRFFRPEWGVDRGWFRQRSPVRVEGLSAGEFLDAMFRPWERVLVFTDFRSQGDYLWEAGGRGGFRLGRQRGVRAVPSALPAGGREGVWFLNQPVTGQWAPMPFAPAEDGRPRLGRRSQANVTRWPHLVLESDEAPEPEWMCLLARLELPVAAIYTSGGRSIHALVRVDCETKAAWDVLRRHWVPVLSTLGADAGAMTAVRLTRLPGCMRGTREQELLYCDPAPDPAGVPIADR